ncbi:TonB-dependent receptor [Chitinophaga sp. MM2321]|uniref:TonB-dependent receptor n=1 Tax=Chitinophaga sp. MM2321 TaxID=3137178 RepID=UPI0032D5695E
MLLARKLLTGMLLMCIPLSVLGWDWQTRVTVVVKDQPLQVVCELLEKEYGIHFSYSRELVNLSRKVTVTVYHQRLKSVLEELFVPDEIRYTRVGDQLVLQPAIRTTRTISGYVQDAFSGEKLPGATIWSPALKQGTTTNQFGYFSITTIKDTNSLAVSYIGYDTYLQPVTHRGDQLLTVALLPVASLKEVVVTAIDRNKLQDQTQMSKMSIPQSVVQSMPKLLGEADLMRTLHSIPGVGGGMDGAGGLHVRGGSPDQNLILLDGTPVFNFSHFFGVYSLLNADVVKSTELYKGAFPARFGGRLSSVVDITMKDGDMKNYHGDVGVGMISARFNLEGPIVKDKTSFIISGRRSYPDLIYNILRSENDFGRDGAFNAFFYDVHAKINHIFSPKDRIYLSLYKGEDNLLVKQVPDNTDVPADPTKIRTESVRFRLGWGNTIGALRWNHIYGPQLFSNASLNYSEYAFLTEYGFKYSLPASRESSDQYGTYSSRMKNASAKIDFDYRPDPRHSIRFGTAVTGHYFKPGMTDFEDKSSGIPPLDTTYRALKTQGLEFILYAEDDWQLRTGLYVNLGVHASAFLVNGRLYQSVQPRLGFRYMLPRNWALKGAYTHMTQYIHLLSNNGISLPMDIWVPSTQRVAPMFSRQLATGLAKTSNNGSYEFSMEGYFKSMFNMIEYTSDRGFVNQDLVNWDEKVVVGKGWSYGGEVMIRKQKGKTTGWIGYTLAWSTRRFPGINNNQTFPYKYDHRHDIELVLTQQLGKHWELSGSWHYTTGAPLTLPVSSYEGTTGASPWDPGSGSHEVVDRYDYRYNYRTENIHRLDVGITYSKQKKYWRKSWNLSVYNVYNQQNPFFYYMKKDEVEKQRYLAKVTVLPILPSVTYSIRF